MVTDSQSKAQGPENEGQSLYSSHSQAENSWTATSRTDTAERETERPRQATVRETQPAWAITDLGSSDDHT